MLNIFYDSDKKTINTVDRMIKLPSDTNNNNY